MENIKNIEKKQEREPFGQMIKIISNTTYEVNFYFSETSK